MLNPQWLQTFVALTELGNFTRAAERQQITQAAVSQHLRQLEDRLGLLVIRRTRGIELTPAGEALLEYCKELEVADKKLRLRLTDDTEAGGEISLITPGSIGLALFPLLLDLQKAASGLDDAPPFRTGPGSHRRRSGQSI
ncbi:LysR family transcriptional regulator [Burkholderia sp. WSM2232]|uniref:LysR family transcriptional regulator n=1 Tax=Burkholderia sp. WSM2232 TaxID=944436 RepID=UPI0004087B79|nr:LysR family transcriptional regulator [Burkholderia sp. WSM2232]